MAHRNYQRATRPLIRNVEEYSKMMSNMNAMMLDYLTYSQVPSYTKEVISRHLSLGADTSGLIASEGAMFHGYEMVGDTPTIEVWVLPIRIENQPLLAVWAVEADKYYLQDTPLRIRKIA